jgi:hypothetical protein
MKLTAKFGLHKISNDDVVIAPHFSRLGGLESRRDEGRAFGIVDRLNPAAHHQRRRGVRRCCPRFAPYFSTFARADKPWDSEPGTSRS